MLSQTEQRVLEQCDRLFPQALDMTRDLVSQYSVLGREQGALETLIALIPALKALEQELME